MSSTPERAAIYVRISDDRDRDAEGVGRQSRDAHAHAKRLGWHVTEVFTENDTSAFKRKMVLLPNGERAYRVVRPEFRRMLDLIDAGAIDGLIAYHLDRVARDPRDLEDLIDVVERTRVPVESVTGSLRLATDADITMARIGVAIANQASRDSSRRIKRKHEELAEQGKYAGGGARRYGYERDGVTINAREAENIRWAAARVLEGMSVSAVGRELDAQGARPVKAARWSSRTLGDLLTSPRIAGLRVHRGEVVGTAEWPAIVDQETHEALVATIRSRARGLTQPALKRWCNQLLFCGLCGTALSGNSAATSKAKYRYWCDPLRGGCGGIAISGPGVEAEVERQVLEYLRSPAVLKALGAASSDARLPRVRSDIADDEAQLKDLSRLWAEKRITLGEYAEARRIIEERLESARKVLRSVTPGSVRPILSSPNVEDAWHELTPPAKRDLVRTLVKGWKVHPADMTKPRQFDPTRLELLS